MYFLLEFRKLKHMIHLNQDNNHQSKKYIIRIKAPHIFYSYHHIFSRFNHPKMYHLDSQKRIRLQTIIKLHSMLNIFHLDRMLNIIYYGTTYKNFILNKHKDKNLPRRRVHILHFH